jgi:hypothetical protein
MRDHNHRHAAGAEVGDELKSSLDHFRIQRGGGLVEEHHLRRHGQRAGDRNPLLLASRQHSGAGTGLVLQANSLQLSQREFLGRVRGQPAQLARPQRDVLEDAQMREQVVVLKHHADALAEPVGIVVQYRPSVEQDVATIGLVEAIQGAQQRRLTGARGPDYRHCGTGGGFESHATQHLVPAEGFMNIPGFQRY